MSEREEILNFARIMEEVQTIQIHSGDREPGTDVNATGKGWIIAGLKLLAESKTK